MLLTTAEDSYNIFRPNIEEPDLLEIEDGSTVEGSQVKGVSRDSDEEEEEKKMVRKAKKMNR